MLLSENMFISQDLVMPCTYTIHVCARQTNSPKWAQTADNAYSGVKNTLIHLRIDVVRKTSMKTGEKSKRKPGTKCLAADLRCISRSWKRHHKTCTPDKDRCCCCSRVRDTNSAGSSFFFLTFVQYNIIIFWHYHRSKDETSQTESRAIKRATSFS